jgi:hypothetical protein
MKEERYEPLTVRTDGEYQSLVVAHNLQTDSLPSCVAVLFAINVLLHLLYPLTHVRFPMHCIFSPMLPMTCMIIKEFIREFHNFSRNMAQMHLFIAKAPATCCA